MYAQATSTLSDASLTPANKNLPYKDISPQTSAPQNKKQSTQNLDGGYIIPHASELQYGHFKHNISLLYKSFYSSNLYDHERYLDSYLKNKINMNFINNEKDIEDNNFVLAHNIKNEQLHGVLETYNVNVPFKLSKECIDSLLSQTLGSGEIGKSKEIKKSATIPNQSGFNINTKITGQYMASLTTKNKIAVYNVKNLEELTEHKSPLGILDSGGMNLSNCLTIRGAAIIGADTEGTILVWHLPKLKKKINTPGFSHKLSFPSCIDKDLQINDLATISQKPTIHGVTQSKELFHVDLRDMKLGIAKNAHMEGITCLALSEHDQNNILTGSEKGVVRLWDKRNIKTAWEKSLPVDEFEMPSAEYPVSQLKWSPNQRNCYFFASLSKDGTMSLFDSNKRRTPPKFRHFGHRTEIASFDWLKNESNKFTFGSISIPEKDRYPSQVQVWSINEMLLEPNELLR